jgi:hypothetical protein
MKMGGPEMAPHTPQRSGRPGKAVASLDIHARAAPAKPWRPSISALGPPWQSRGVPRYPRSGRPGKAVASLDIPRSGRPGKAVAAFDVPLAHPLDPDKGDGVAVGADGEADAVTGGHARGVQRCGRAAHGHHFHGAHAEAGNGLVANEDEIGRGTGDELTTDLVGGRTDDRSPEPGGEETNQDDEEDNDEPARGGAPAQRPRASAPTRRRGPPRA